MAHIHPKDAEKSPQKPFESEETWAQEATRVLKEQRRESGGLPDSSTEVPARVQDDDPFKKLKSP